MIGLHVQLLMQQNTQCIVDYVDVICCIAEISNDTFSWQWDLFPLTTDNLINKICDNITSGCCSVENCDRPIINQVEYFINTDNIERIDSISFNFSFATLFQEEVVEDYNPVDAKFFIKVSLDNLMHGSGMSVEANFDKYPELKRFCTKFRRQSTIVDISVMILLILSSYTYILSIIQTLKLAKDVKLHFLAYHEKQLRWREISPLFNKWYIVMLITNVLILVATVFKVVSEYMEYISITLVQIVSILLGIGIFLLWCSLFGILSYFESLNVLLITIQLAFPSILRFAICILILFIAFALCGWLVIGPYHPKFNGFLVTTESLFCILNGDDLYGTFEGIDVRFTLANSVRLFSKFYLCLFIFLFIYIALSLFIGIFNHAYESLSDNWRQRSRGFLRDWAEKEPHNDPSVNYPFPVPTIRKFPSNSSISSCSDDEHTSGLNKSKPPTYANSPVPEIYISPPEPMSSNTNNSSQSPNNQGDGATNEYLSLNPPNCNQYALPGDHKMYQHLLRKRQRSRISTGRRLTHAKSIVADPPSANKEEVFRARYKLQPINPSAQVSMEESDV